MRTSSYRRSIATMALSCIVSEINRDIGRNSQFVYPIICIRHPVRGPGPNIVIGLPFGTEKLEQWIYRIVKKFEDTFTPFDTIHKRDTRTDGHRTTA